MKSATCVVLSLLIVTISCTSKQLIGADDVDKKHAELAEGKNPLTPVSIVEVKQKLKEEKKEIKQLHDRVLVLKEELHDNTKSKAEKKALLKEFKDTKDAMKAKKLEVNELKKEITDLKNEKLRAKLEAKKEKENKKGNKKHHHLALIGEDEKNINEQTSDSTSQKKKSFHKKHGNKVGNGNKYKDEDNQEDAEVGNSSKGSKKSDKPKLRMADLDSQSPPRRKGGRIGRIGNRGGNHKNNHRKISCTTDDQCADGAVCVPNRKGNKFCKPRKVSHKAKRNQGDKCHSTKQCAEGLKCVASNEGLRKGICTRESTGEVTSGFVLA